MISTELDPRAMAAVAERLLPATSARIPCWPVRDLIGGHDLDAASAVPEHVTASARF